MHHSFLHVGPQCLRSGRWRLLIGQLGSYCKHQWLMRLRLQLLQVFYGTYLGQEVAIKVLTAGTDNLAQMTKEVRPVKTQGLGSALLIMLEVSSWEYRSWPGGMLCCRAKDSLISCKPCCNLRQEAASAAQLTFQAKL